MAFLTPGQFLRRFEPSASEVDDGEEPFLARYDYGHDVLAEMTNEVLRLVRLRTPAFTAVWDLSAYCGAFRARRS